MSTVLFVAIVRGTPSEGYRAAFPDVPACEAEGRDLGELISNARQALTRSLEARAATGEAWPTPTPLEEVAKPQDALAIPIDVSVDDPPIRVNISLGERLLQRLDAAAEVRNMTRSGFIAQSVRVSLDERGAAREEFASGYRKLEDELTAMGRRINEALGPDSAFSRRMADLDDKVVEGVRRAADSVSAAMARRQEAYRATSVHPESGGRPDAARAENQPPEARD